MADTIDTPTPDTTAPDNNAPDTKGNDTPDLAAVVATLTAQVAALTADKAKADAQAEEARKASLSEAERLAEDRKAVDAERKGLVADARKAAAERLGINPKAMGLVPDVDPRTPEGAAALEAFAKDNPEFVKAAVPTPSGPPKVPEKSKMAKLLAGEITHPLMDKDTLAAVLQRM